MKGFQALVLGLLLTAPSMTLAEEFSTNIYGYVDAHIEKQEDGPALDGAGNTIKEPSPMEYTVPNIHFVMLSRYGTRYKAFLNMKGPDAEGVEVSNAWVEGTVIDQYLNFRLGKIYRPFDLYNEILDAVPTYIGIEPPELFDKDHLMLTRTTSTMLHGRAAVGDNGYLNYAFTTGQDEGTTEPMPIGFDVRYLHGTNWTVGASYYTTNGPAEPAQRVDATTTEVDSPIGGVLPWMDDDDYNVAGGYIQYLDKNWTVQFAYYTSSHDGNRNADSVDFLCNNGGLNTAQMANFNCAGGAGNYDLTADFDVKTWYTRLGYTFSTESMGDLTPYLQYDFYDNPETIQNKDLGGDNEAGLADDGQFTKWTAGVVFKPVEPVAVKLDVSEHFQEFNGKDENYGEVRFSFSYYWRL